MRSVVLRWMTCAAAWAYVGLCIDMFFHVVPGGGEVAYPILGVSFACVVTSAVGLTVDCGRWHRLYRERRAAEYIAAERERLIVERLSVEELADRIERQRKLTQ